MKKRQTKGNTKRRAPVQGRAKKTVQSILEATAQVLVKEGYAKTSTNKIAARAGVSIGTIYEYFPDKDAVVAALLNSIVFETVKRLQGRMASLIQEPLPLAAKQWLHAAVDLLGEHAGLARVVVEQIPRLQEIAAVQMIEKQMLAFARQMAVESGERYNRSNLDAGMFLVVTMVRAAVIGIALERPSHLSAEELIDELVNVMVGYYNYRPLRR
ncbi:MAG: TetR/AcrR family transcriptional regulator [Bdellovibrionota bacterium]